MRGKEIALCISYVQSYRDFSYFSNEHKYVGN